MVIPPPELPPEEEEPASPLCDGAFVCGFAVELPNVGANDGAYVGVYVGMYVGARVGARVDGDKVVVATTDDGDGGADGESVGA